MIYRRLRNDRDWPKKVRASSAFAFSLGIAVLLIIVFGVAGLSVLFTVPQVKETASLDRIPGKPYYVVSRSTEGQPRTATIYVRGESTEVTGSPTVYYVKNERNPRIEVSKERFRTIDKFFGMDELETTTFTDIYVPALEKEALWFHEMHRKVRDIDEEIAVLDVATSYDGALSATLVAEQRKLTWDKIHALAVDRDLNAEIYNNEAAKASEADFHIQVDYEDADYQIPVKYQAHWSASTSTTVP